MIRLVDGHPNSLSDGPAKPLTVPVPSVWVARADVVRLSLGKLLVNLLQVVTRTGNA